MDGQRSGNIPVLAVQGVGMAEAWENSLLELHKRGCEIRTEYDPKNEDGTWAAPPSKDCTMMMTVLDPASEPAIHRAIPGGLDALEEYRQEVVDGNKDGWTRDPNDPEDTKWEYTYHQRLRAYLAHTVERDVHQSGLGTVTLRPVIVDQIEDIVKKLAVAPYSRRCNAVVWSVGEDRKIGDPPCCQSVWCRILPDDEGVWHLNMDVRFRSRDAYDAAFMNMWGFAGPDGLQGDIARAIAEEASREVKLGRYCDLSDSYHIYGTRLADFRDRFLSLVEKRPFEERTYTREFAQVMFDEAKPEIAAKVAKQNEKLAAERAQKGKT